MRKGETKRLSEFRKKWRAAGNRSLFYFCSVLQWLQKNGGSDRFEKFFFFAEHVSSRAEPLYYAVKISDFEKKIRKHEFFVKNFHFLKFSWIFLFKQLQPREGSIANTTHFEKFNSHQKILLQKVFFFVKLFI